MTEPSKTAMAPRNAALWLIAVLILAACLRLYRLDSPIADEQSWNQVSAATVIRHFTRDGVDFFHTRWDVLKRGTTGPRIEV
jgi:hypothetical protein